MFSTDQIAEASERDADQDPQLAQLVSYSHRAWLRHVAAYVRSPFPCASCVARPTVHPVFSLAFSFAPLFFWRFSVQLMDGSHSPNPCLCLERQISITAFLMVYHSPLAGVGDQFSTSPSIIARCLHITLRSLLWLRRAVELHAYMTNEYMKRRNRFPTSLKHRRNNLWTKLHH